MGGNLERYLQTGAAPLDLEYYAEHDIDTCPLCLEPNDGYMQHAFSMEDGTWINAIICQECHVQIEENEVYQEDKFWEDIPSDLRTYIQTGRFPKNAHRWTKYPFICPFCKRDIEDDWWPMQLPIGDDMVGGELAVCHQCATFTNYQLHKNTYYARCRKCGERYSVTQNEYEVRQNYHNLDDHMCHECATRVHGPFEPADRFQSKSCRVCNDSVVLDLFLSDLSDLETPKCVAHAGHIHDEMRTKWNIRVLPSRKNSDYRAVITDRKTLIKLTYEKQDNEHPPWYTIIDEENILPNTVSPGNLVWRALNRLNTIVDEDNS